MLHIIVKKPHFLDVQGVFLSSKFTTANSIFPSICVHVSVESRDEFLLIQIKDSLGILQLNIKICNCYSL